MKSERKEKIEWVLTLDESERDWIRSIVQNPMWVNDPADENEDDKSMRHKIWNALS